MASSFQGSTFRCETVVCEGDEFGSDEAFGDDHGDDDGCGDCGGVVKNNPRGQI